MEITSINNLKEQTIMDNTYLIIIDYNSGTVNIFDCVKTIVEHEQTESFIQSKGFNLDEVNYMITHNEPVMDYI